jgi:hypothetical protein
LSDAINDERNRIISTVMNDATNTTNSPFEQDLDNNKEENLNEDLTLMKNGKDLDIDVDNESNYTAFI